MLVVVVGGKDVVLFSSLIAATSRHSPDTQCLPSEHSVPCSAAALGDLR